MDKGDEDNHTKNNNNSNNLKPDTSEDITGIAKQANFNLFLPLLPLLLAPPLFLLLPLPLLLRIPLFMLSRLLPLLLPPPLPLGKSRWIATPLRARSAPAWSRTPPRTTITITDLRTGTATPQRWSSAPTPSRRRNTTTTTITTGISTAGARTKSTELPFVE